MRAAERLGSAALLLLAALPLVMAVANRSAPLLTVLAALLSVAGRAMSGQLTHVARDIRRRLATPLGIACLAFCLWGVISLAWSQHRGLSAHALGELAISAAAPLALAASLPRAIPRSVVVAAASLMAAGCASILVELATGSAVRAFLGFRSEYFIFKRSATAILIVFWPLAALLWLAGRRLAATAVGAALAAAILWAHAAAGALGLVVGLACLGLAWLSRRAATWALGAALLASLALAPITGDLAARALGDPVLDRLHEMQARDRILIWQSFGEVVRRRTLAGTGFGTSAALGRNSVADEVPADRREMLAVGHPHNGYLQIWTETGLVGAALAALAIVLLLRGIARLPRVQGCAALAVAGCAGVIMLVAHGAWQGWWIATLGAAAVWTVRLPAGAPGLQSAGSFKDPPRKPVAST